MKRSLDVARRLTTLSLDWESSASPGLDWELNESSSTKGTASDLEISELQNSVTASGRTIPVEDERSVNRHYQTRWSWREVLSCGELLSALFNLKTTATTS